MDKVWFVNLQSAREKKGFAQVKLAMESGVSQQSITYYETGTRVPSFDVAIRLAKVLDTSIDYLVGYNNDGNKYYSLSQSDRETIDRMIDSLSSKGSNN